VGKRRGYGTAQLDYRPHSAFFIALGTAFLWFGWCCFNGASNSALNLKSIMNINNTLYAGAAGCLGWTAVDFAFTRKWSAVGAASGILAGLIGYVRKSSFDERLDVEPPSCADSLSRLAASRPQLVTSQYLQPSASA